MKLLHAVSVNVADVAVLTVTVELVDTGLPQPAPIVYVRVAVPEDKPVTTPVLAFTIMMASSLLL